MKKSLMPQDYKKYLKLQLGRVDSKWGRRGHDDFVFRERLYNDWREIRDYMKPETIVCMGCRDGTELFEFKTHYGGAQIVGVDITEKIKSIRVSKVNAVSVVVADFSNLPEDWTDKFDLVFSNSLDHAFDPYATVKEWGRVCKGHLFVQLAIKNKPNQIEHCFEEEDVPKLFPDDLFNVIKVWKSETLNVFAEVKSGS